MARYDSVVLYNAASVVEIEGSQERTYPSTIIREEVVAIEESLREVGFNPYVLSVDQFSKDLIQTLLRISPKFVFNLCEEMNGKCELEMCVAGLLELMALPYTGSGPLALGLALHKYRVKQLLRANNIPTARGFLLPPGQELDPEDVHLPAIVKPAHEDASLGINSGSVCRTVEQLQKQVNYIHRIYQQEALVEEYLDGREFNVSVLGDGSACVLAVSEIDFSTMPADEPRIVSYRAKWDEESDVFRGTLPICPAQIPKRLENRIRDIALRAYRCVGLRDYGRVDMRTDARGNLFVLEVNPNPDIAPSAGLARAARAAGLSYTDLISRITQCAVERGSKMSATVYAY